MAPEYAVAETSSRWTSSATFPKGLAAFSSFELSSLPSWRSSFAINWTRRGAATMSGRCPRTLTMDEVPLPERGILRKGVLYRIPAPPPEPKRELDPETLAIIQRGREKLIREYLKRRRGS